MRRGLPQTRAAHVPVGEPPYTQNAFAKLKALLRKVGERTVDGL